MSNKVEVLKAIRRCGIVPAIRVETIDQVLSILDGLRDGGIDLAEIAMSMPDAMRALDAAIAHVGGTMLVGAGTVLDARTANSCIQAGAQFVLSPTLHPEVIECCHQYGIVVCPGAFTPTEILTAWKLGADLVKVFPVSAAGGASYIKALKAPLPQLQLLPMGGVSLDSAADYLNAGSFALGIGSDLARAGDSSQQTYAKAREYRAIVEHSTAAGLRSTPEDLAIGAHSSVRSSR